MNTIKNIKLMVSGANGQLGREIVYLSKAMDIQVIALDREELDIRNKDAIISAIEKYAPNIFVNCAAYTSVDSAENKQEEAFAINRDGAALVAEYCRKNKIPLIHISTDFVFNGRRGLPYPETAITAPLNVYGQSKAEGEAAVRARQGRHIILRTSWLYSRHAPNFLTTMLILGREQKTLRVVADQHGCPTSARDLAEAILEICPQILSPDFQDWGTYHYCGGGITTWHSFAEAIIKTARKFEDLKVEEVRATSTEDYPAITYRPPYSVLDCTKIRQNFGIRTKFWQDSMFEVIKEIYLE